MPSLPPFHEDAIFPTDISYGSVGGPEFSTAVLDLTSGHEQRNINWSEARAKYDVKWGVKQQFQAEQLLNFFNARRGKAFGFRYFDWNDHEIIDQSIGTGNGIRTSMQLFKRYEPGPYQYDRVIRKPIDDGKLVVSVGGEIVPVVMHYDTGVVDFYVAPADGADVRIIECNFHVAVRFDIDHLPVSNDDYDNLSVSSIPLIEIKPQS